MLKSLFTTVAPGGGDKRKNKITTKKIHSSFPSGKSTLQGPAIICPSFVKRAGRGNLYDDDEAPDDEPDDDDDDDDTILSRLSAYHRTAGRSQSSSGVGVHPPTPIDALMSIGPHSTDGKYWCLPELHGQGNISGSVCIRVCVSFFFGGGARL